MHYFTLYMANVKYNVTATMFHNEQSLTTDSPSAAHFFNEIEPNYNSMFTTETFCKYFGLGGRQRKRMKTALEYALNLRLPGSTVRAI